MRTRSAGLLVAAILATAGCDPGGAAVVPGIGEARASVVAADLAFEPVDLRMPANRRLVITLDNRDDGVPHNLTVLQGEREVVQGEIVIGPATVEVAIPPLPLGEYRFACSVHPSMTGTLLVVP